LAGDGADASPPKSGLAEVHRRHGGDAIATGVNHFLFIKRDGSLGLLARNGGGEYQSGHQRAIGRWHYVDHAAPVRWSKAA